MPGFFGQPYRKAFIVAGFALLVCACRAWDPCQVISSISSERNDPRRGWACKARILHCWNPLRGMAQCASAIAVAEVRTTSPSAMRRKSRSLWITARSRLTTRWIACLILTAVIPAAAFLPSLATLGLVAAALAAISLVAPRHRYVR